MNRAGPESQLGTAPCGVADTEEMFWLRQNDDYQSKLGLAAALVSQYRYRDAVDACRDAERIKSDDPALYTRLGGALLTLRRFGEAQDAYRTALRLGGSERAAAYPLGIRHYLLGEYTCAAERFAGCLPCGDEMRIAVLYWHALACLRASQASSLLELYHPGMDVGHHGAYARAVSVFAGETALSDALAALSDGECARDFCIEAYGLARFLAAAGPTEEAEALLRRVLERTEVWPNVAYLAAWNDLHTQKGQSNE